MQKPDPLGTVWYLIDGLFVFLKQAAMAATANVLWLRVTLTVVEL